MSLDDGGPVTGEREWKPCLLGDFVFFQAEDGIRDYKVTGVQTCALFFQAEDGIRDYKVTGVQTCALPISELLPQFIALRRSDLRDADLDTMRRLAAGYDAEDPLATLLMSPGDADVEALQIGRASCRERV